jgi:kanosamine 6-kinase
MRVAMDLGGSGLRVAVFDGVERREDRRALPRLPSAGAELDWLCAHLAIVTGAPATNVTHVVVAAACTVEADGTVARWPSRPHWRGLPLGGALQQAIGVAVRFEDDGTAAAIAEADAAGIDDLLYVGLGTGVGGGVVLGGRACRGPDGRAGELGHVPVAADGPSCRCGRTGCLQAYASASAILEEARCAGGREPTLAGLGDALAAGEQWATDACRPAAAALARVLVAAHELLGIRAARLGGGVVEALPALPSFVGELVASARREAQPSLDVRFAELGAGASLRGAELLAADPNLCAWEES